MSLSETDSGAFERLLADISTRFINAAPARVDDEIVEALRLLVEFIGVDRSNMVQWSADGLFLENTHHYVVEGFAPIPRLIAQEVFPYAFGRLLQGHVFSFSSLDELPPEAVVDRATLEKIGPKSNLSFPLIVGAPWWGRCSSAPCGTSGSGPRT